MKNLLYYLLPKVLLLIIIGILIADKIILNTNFFIIILSLIFLLTICIILLSKHKITNVFTNILIIILIISLGFALKANKNLAFYNYDCITYNNEYFVFKITSNYKETPKNYKYKAKIINKGRNYPNVLLYFNKSENVFLEKNNIILVKTKLSKITNSDKINFDYKKYCFRNSIGYNCFLNKNDILKIQKPKKDIFNFHNKVQNFLLQKLLKNSNSKVKSEIAGAIVLGENNLDKQTREYFSSSGIIHVLCVSGLHITLVYSIIYFLFSLINIKKIKKLFAPVISLIVLWFYASITGFSASVCRASFMITFLTISKILKRDSNSFLILCGAAFTMILINPNVLFNIGFKLSHLAVLGIIVSKPITTKLSEICSNIKIKYLKNLTTKLVQGITISIFAQIFIAPILIYHFKTFSNYFIFGNLIAIPLASIILYIGFFLLFIPTSILFDFISTIFYFLISVLYNTAVFINMLPFSVSIFKNFSILQITIYVLTIYCVFNLIRKGFSFKRIKKYLISFNTIMFIGIFINVVSIYL